MSAKRAVENRDGSKILPGLFECQEISSRRSNHSRTVKWALRRLGTYSAFIIDLGLSLVNRRRAEAAQSMAVAKPCRGRKPGRNIFFILRSFFCVDPAMSPEY